MVTTTKQIRHRGPAQKRVLDADVILLRKVNVKKIGAGIYEKIAQTALRPGEYEGDQPWFQDGFVAGEQPRNAMVAQAIMDTTLGFAIARTDSGEILAEFDKSEVEKAETVTHSATTQLAVDVMLDKVADDEEEVA